MPLNTEKAPNVGAERSALFSFSIDSSTRPRTAGAVGGRGGPEHERPAADLASEITGEITGEITCLIRDWQDRNPGRLDELMPRVLAELRQMAQAYFQREDPSHTLQPTALVNEVYMRLCSGQIGELRNRSEFFAFVARLMRQILVDHARSRKAVKRGGRVSKVALDEAFGLSGANGPDAAVILALDAALDRLERLDPRQKAVVELRYLVGSSIPEIAEILEVSRATVERDWTVARHWLAREMSRR